MALVALVVLVGGLIAFIYNYRQKLVTESYCYQQNASSEGNILESVSGLPFNFPREALLRQPPPRYTSQQDLSFVISHVNAGFHDDEVMRPPPCYSSNPDLSSVVPHLPVNVEPPPSYSSQLDLTQNTNNHDLQGFADVNGGLLTIFQPPVPISSHDEDNKQKVECSSEGHNNANNEWCGHRWNGAKAIKKQNEVSSSCDSNLDELHQPGPFSRCQDAVQDKNYSGSGHSSEMPDRSCQDMLASDCSVDANSKEVCPETADSDHSVTSLTGHGCVMSENPSSGVTNRVNDSLDRSSVDVQANEVSNCQIQAAGHQQPSEETRTNSLPLLASLSNLSRHPLRIDNDVQGFYC